MGGTLLVVGIFFFTEHRFGWSTRGNFMLAAAQGTLYVLGALLADRLTRCFGRARLLVMLYLTMAALATPAIVHPAPGLVTGLLLAYTLLIAVSWPVLESLVSSGASPHELSRRLGVYNLIWSGASALTFAASGLLIKHGGTSIFLIGGMAHALGAALLLGRRSPQPAPAAAPPDPAAPAPAPKLRQQRRMALWLSRLTLPATFVVVFGMMPMLPSLPLIDALPDSLATVVASMWMATRWLSFWALGATTWWHTRPRALLAAALAMFLAFLGTLLSGNQAGPAIAWALPLMLLWQALLGIALGMIYTASLYFGMVLSDGSTEHGGYHEALIGLGQVLGPAAGLLAFHLRPGDTTAGILAVAAVIALSVLAAGLVSVRSKSLEDASPDSPVAH